MNIFLKKVLFFIIPFLIILYPLDIYLSEKMIEKAEGETSVWTDIYSSNINAEIIIEGSSRASTHFDPILIEDSLNTSCYNLGLDGHSFFLQHFRHLEFLKYNKKPKIIVYEIGYLTFSKSKVPYNFESLSPYILYNNTIRKNTKEYNYYHFLDYYIPLIRYYGKTPKILGQSFQDEVRIKGYNGLPVKENKDKPKITKKTFQVEIDSNLVLLFEHYLTKCVQENIKVILMYPPEYKKHQRLVSNRTEIMTLFIELSKRHNVPFYDYSNDFISEDFSYFKDASHLNKKGSQLFTQKIIPILKNKLE